MRPYKTNNILNKIDGNRLIDGQSPPKNLNKHKHKIKIRFLLWYIWLEWPSPGKCTTLTRTFRFNVNSSSWTNKTRYKTRWCYISESSCCWWFTFTWFNCYILFLDCWGVEFLCCFTWASCWYWWDYAWKYAAFFKTYIWVRCRYREIRTNKKQLIPIKINSWTIQIIS